MNLRHLRTFVAIVDAGSMAKASGRLNLTQPAASRQIQALEDDLQLKLFERVGRRVRLSTDGEQLLRRSRRLLAEAESFSQHARILKHGEAGTLRVGATPQVIENTLAPFLAPFRRRRPTIEVQLVEDGAASLRRRLQTGDVQLAAIAAIDESFLLRPLYPVYALAVFSTTHRLGRRHSVDVKQLAEEPLLLLQRTFASREWLEAACSVAHIHPRILLESAAPHTIIALAEEGHGVGVVPSTVVIRDGRLRAAPLVQRGFAIGRWLAIGWDAERFLPRYAEQFVDDLASYCARTHPGREFIRHVRPPGRPKELPNAQTSSLP